MSTETRRPEPTITVRTNGTTEVWTVEDDLADRRPEPKIEVRGSGLSEDDDATEE